MSLVVNFNDDYDLGVVETFDEALALINKFCKEENFKSYYTRVWPNDTQQRLIVDFGSWSRFCYIIPDNKETMNELLIKYFGKNKGGE